MKLIGRKAIITGASHGFGFKVAEAFLREGAQITLCARNTEMLQQARAQLLDFAGASSKITCVTADVSQVSDVERLMQTAFQNMAGIDILVANAGVYGAKGALDNIDWEEWSQAIDINLKGTVLVCKMALPYLKLKLKQQQYRKIILLSGGGATKPMPFLSAYAASKAAVVRFGETLAGELSDYQIDVNCIAPGALNTRLLEEVLLAGPEKVGKSFYEQSLKQKEAGGSSLELGANLCVYLASQQSDGITGKLISAVWDPWQDLEKYKKQLQNSDIYTLRRIVPNDRGENWN